MILKKQSTWSMCPYFHVLNKFTIKYKFGIPFIDVLLDINKWKTNAIASHIIKKIQKDSNPPLGYTWKHYTFRYKYHIFCGT